MDTRGSRISRSLNFRITLPVVTLVFLVWLGLNFFVLESIEQFQRNRIQEDMEWTARFTYNIINEHYYDLVRSGAMEDERYLRIEKGRSIGSIEDFMRQKDFVAVVHSRQEDRILTTGVSATRFTPLIREGIAENVLHEIIDSGRGYYAYRVEFEPWQWDIILLKDISDYASLLQKVRNINLAVGIILVLAAFLLYSTLRWNIHRPIRSIISSIARSSPPQFQGTTEFEYLSSSIRTMMAGLEEREAFLESIFNSISDGISILDTEMNVVRVNPTMEKWYQHSAPLTGRKCYEVYHGRSEECEKCPSRTTMQTGQTCIMVVPRVGPHGRTVGWLELHSFPLMDQKTGVMKGVIEYVRDITESQIARERIQASLAEKEVLLKEIHHRVKNNLQIISSLLNLQAHHVDDRYDREIYRESQNRVITMALIHEELYQARDLARVDFGAYIQNLTQNLFASYGIDPQRIHLTLDTEDLDVVVDTAIPAGLILNELISNALKHAFPGERGGSVRVGFHSVGENNYVLEVADDGIGLPEDMDLWNTKSLGMQLVTVIIEQLGGDLDVSREGGTSFRIRFSEYREAGTVLF
ncbi:MAG: PAS domain-containing protein [bacterium]|nr:MAG: PAS domain-containing protein [bacterium]